MDKPEHEKIAEELISMLEQKNPEYEKLSPHEQLIEAMLEVEVEKLSTPDYNLSPTTFTAKLTEMFLRAHLPNLLANEATSHQVIRIVAKYMYGDWEDGDRLRWWTKNDEDNAFINFAADVERAAGDRIDTWFGGMEAGTRDRIDTWLFENQRSFSEKWFREKLRTLRGPLTDTQLADYLEALRKELLGAAPRRPVRTAIQILLKQPPLPKFALVEE